MRRLVGVVALVACSCVKPGWEAKRPIVREVREIAERICAEENYRLCLVKVEAFREEADPVLQPEGRADNDRPIAQEVRTLADAVCAWDEPWHLCLRKCERVRNEPPPGAIAPAN